MWTLSTSWGQWTLSPFENLHLSIPSGALRQCDWLIWALPEGLLFFGPDSLLSCTSTQSLSLGKTPLKIQGEGCGPHQKATIEDHMRLIKCPSFLRALAEIQSGEQVGQSLFQRMAPLYFVRRNAIVSHMMEFQTWVAVAQAHMERWGILDPLWQDPAVTEILCNPNGSVWVERYGQLSRTGLAFPTRQRLVATMERMLASCGRRIDALQPASDGRLQDGSRIHALLPPLCPDGPCLTIRRFPQQRPHVGDLVAMGSLTESQAHLMARAVALRKNILISGGTGTGKTTLLNICGAYLGPHERIVTLEDAAELALPSPHVVRLEARRSGLEGQGEVSLRELLRHALRMRPDRILLGECRGAEALDMLQAMNTGHDGSLTTVHASTPLGALRRIETLCLYAGIDLPGKALRENICSALHVIIHIQREASGLRKVSHIERVLPLKDNGEFQTEPLSEEHLLWDS